MSERPDCVCSHAASAHDEVPGQKLGACEFHGCTCTFYEADELQPWEREQETA